MRNMLTNIANNQPLLIAMGVVGLVLMIWAVIRGFRNIRGAIAPALPGLILLGLVLFAVILNPFALGFDSERPDLVEHLEFSNQSLDADDWPQWRGVNRDGIGRATGLRLDWEKNPPEVLWTTPCRGGYSSFAVVGNRVWTQDYHDGKEQVICLDATTGVQQWSYEYAADYSVFKLGYNEGPRATPAVHDGRIYTVGATGKFLCLEADPANGKPHLLWEHDLVNEFKAELPTWGVACSPLIFQNLVIVQPGGAEGSIVAFDRISGNKVWSALDDPSGYSSPVAAKIQDIQTIVAMTGLRLVILSAEDGRLLWSYDWPTQFYGNIATPIVFNNSIFISSNYNAGCALLSVVPSDGKPSFEIQPVFVRRNKLMRNHHMTCVLHEGHVYGFDGERLKCVDLRTATVSWETNAVSQGKLILADNYLLVQAGDGALVLIEAKPDEFKLKGKLPNVLSDNRCWSQPALSRGRLYMRDHEKIVCLK
jgi:outer membrane protein assembly factor BamB